MNLAVMLRRTAHAFGSRPAVVAPAGSLTWAQYYDRACRLAQGLASLGARPQDTVASLGDNSAELLECVGACALGNYARAALYPYHAPEVNGYLLDLIEAKVLVIERNYYDLLEAELRARPHIAVVVLSDVPDGRVPYEQLIAGATPDDPLTPIDDDDIHIVRFSSGTTGRPKAIWHSTARWRGQSVDFGNLLPTMDERDRFLAAGAMTHVGVGNLWQIIQSGACVVPMRKFDADEALRLIEEEQITYGVAAPVMIKAMVESPEAAARDVSTLRCLWYAGSPIAESTLMAAVDLFGDALFQIYGMSEASPISVLRPHEHLPVDRSRRHRSAGRPNHNMDVTIRDDDGKIAPAGVIGEVAARSHGTMSGILNDPEATAARLLPDGSVLTRDVGFFDEEGFLHLVDRKDDMIVSGGYNIWPAELEQALAEHPAVAEACVVGVPHERWGETPLAAVVLHPGVPAPTADELIQFTRDRVGPVKKPSRVDIVAELPRTGTGKVLRRLLRDLYADPSSRVGGS